MDRSKSRFTVLIFGALLSAPISAQVTQRASVGSGGAQANGSSDSPSVSADGRFVAFESVASNLVAGDTNGWTDIFVYDRQNGTTERVSVSSGGVQVSGASNSPSISADGRYVAFESVASHLVSGDTNGSRDIFVHDRQSGTTERVSVDSGGAQANNESFYSSISADGRYVAFFSYATNLVPGVTNGLSQLYLRDRQNGTTEWVSVDLGGTQSSSANIDPASLSADGRYVAFDSSASNLVPGDTNGVQDVFVRDRVNGTTERVSIDSGGAQGNDHSYHPSISADGRFVAFYSFATTLVRGDTNGCGDVFIRDRVSGRTERVSVDSVGTQGNNWSADPSISADGRYVAFDSAASNLVPRDTNAAWDVFVRDRSNGRTERISVDTGGAQGNGRSYAPSISAVGRFAAFYSNAPNLVSGDTNGWFDVFVHDRDATGFRNLCDPGVGGVIACPCSNSPSGSGRGCDNSASTGGAVLSAAGIAYLSVDTLVFTTHGERPTALSILMQGNAPVAGGAVYGQGVRCVGGTTKRLFVKHAVAGSLRAPDFASGDPTVTARSAAKGDVIQSGESRYYLVYYRDPIVLGGCPAGSTFNATQTGVVTWSP